MLILLLNSVIIPCYRFAIDGEGGKKRKKKVSIKEATDSFLILISERNKLQECLGSIKYKLYQEKQTLQPVIIAFGDTLLNVNEFFVCVDGNKYKCDTFLSALDLCFKVFQVLHLKYPEYCSSVWLFIQRYFYEINTVYDQVSPKVSGLITYLNN